jgi:hypothetical protein
MIYWTLRQSFQNCDIRIAESPTNNVWTSQGGKYGKNK